LGCGKLDTVDLVVEDEPGRRDNSIHDHMVRLSDPPALRSRSCILVSAMMLMHVHLLLVQNSRDIPCYETSLMMMDQVQLAE